MKKDKGLGDTIERITNATGISKIVKSVIKECGCKKRKNKLNDLKNYIKKKKKINSEQLILPKFFVICLSRLINFFYPKFPLSQGIIESLTSDVIVRSNIKNFKYNFHINYDYINFIIK